MAGREDAGWVYYDLGMRPQGIVYLPIKAPTHEQNNLNNTNTTKHIYRVPVIIYNTSNTVFCVGDAMTHHEGQNNYYFPDHHNVP